MELKTVDAEAAFELMLALFKAHPWLNKPAEMRPEDATAEAEAVAFLAAGDLSKRWAGLPAPARRVAHALLLDFMGKLRTPGHPITFRSWTVPAGEPPWRQALHLLAAEIARHHPHLAARH